MINCNHGKLDILLVCLSELPCELLFLKRRSVCSKASVNHIHYEVACALSD